ncbi:MAG: hypothetical protein KAR42_14130 [candidate division Zixibacteria bacterium]|nr:hypothetical protein [candidate division Zixibacteria bacterium]
MSTTTKKNGYTSLGSKITYDPEQKFDNKKMRHYSDGKTFVLHCHHYATLFTQLACDAEDMGGTTLLAEAGRETFGEVLSDYYQKHDIKELPDRIAIAEQYFSFVGMGKIEFNFAKNDGFAIMEKSHVDEGWKKKWGNNETPINWMGVGYIQAVWGSVFGKDPAKCTVKETQSIVCGASNSRFSISW